MATTTLETDITTMTATNIAALSVSQLKALTSSQWALIVASQLSELSAEKVAVLPLDFISPQALAGIATISFTSNSLAAINGLAIQKLSAAQVQALTGEQISALTAKKFANFSPEQLSLLSPDKLSAALLGELSAEQVDAFSAMQLAALLNFPSLSAEALSGLTTKNLAGVSAEKINLLNLDRLAALTPSQLNALSSELTGFSDTTLAGLSPETLKGFNANLPANVQIFTVKQIAALTPEKLAAFSIEQLQSITAPQAAVLRASQIAALPPEKATALSTVAIAAIRPQVIKHIDLSLFDSTDISVLTTRQVGQFTATNLAQLTAGNASGLTIEQINSMKAKSLESLPPESRAALLPEVQTAYNTRVIDTTPPQAPAFNFGGQDNFVNLPLVSTQTTVTVSGLEAGATWQYSVDGGSTFVTGAGTSFSLPPDIYAPHTIQVIQRDAAGNQSLEAFNAAQIKAQVAVTAAGTFDAATANVGFQITMGDYLYTVSNFGLGDSIYFPASNTPTISNSNFSDGIVEIQYVLNPNVVIIQINGLTAQEDGQIYSLQSFKSLFGENSITVGSVANNVAPSFNGSLSGALATFNIGGSPVLLDGTVQIYDAELSALNNFEGASLTIQQTPPNAQDVFSVLGGIHTSYFQTGDVWFWQGNGESGTDGSVHVGESAVGSYISGAGSLTISFNWNANQEAVNQVLSSITYSNSAVQAAETISIDWAFNDGFGGESIGSTSVEILLTTLDQTITGGSGNDYLVGGLGNDYIVDSQGDNTLDGGEGNDRLYTNTAYFNGNTWVSGGNGNNTILGGAGNDTIRTASGQDNISGGIGDDLITTTTSEGGLGNDIISGGDGNDTIQSAFGNDSISGDAGDDRITDAGGSNTISGGLGNDTIIVNGYNLGDMQILSGDEGDDRLESAMGNDSLNGGDGNDTLYGNSGSDTLIGGAGNDQYYFSYYYDSNLDNVDQLTGEFNAALADLIHLPEINGTLTVIPTQSSGLASSELTAISLNDLLNTETGTLTNKFGFSGTTVAIITTTDNKTFLAIDINGWGGFDGNSMLIDVTNSTLTSLNTATFVGINFYGTTAHDSITGSDFDDYISGELGNDTLVGNAGNDEILGGDGSDSLLGGIGDDTLLGELGDDYISGDDGNDYIYDYQGNNTLLGGAGDDEISSSSGNNNISSGTGNDTIYAYDGFNTIDAGDGNDYIGLSWWSTTASSFVSAGNGNDTIDGSFGSDTIFGDAGDDEIYDYDGNDSIDGGDGNDKISSYEGNKTLSGGLGNDQIFVGTGNDSLLGGEGDDVIDAGSGNDTILGGIGKNILTGGEGNDTFVFAANTVAPNATTFDTIIDFGLDLDVIDFTDTITIALATATATVGTAQISGNGVANFAAEDDTLAEKIVAIEQAIQLNSLTTGEAVVFVSNYDSYIFISDATAGVGAGDVLIKLQDIVATSLTLNTGNIVAVTSPYSVAGFSDSIASILAEDTIYILDTTANISTNFDSLIIPNLAKIDRLDILNSMALSLSIDQFMTTDVVNVLRENSVAIDAINATLSQITYFHTHIGKIAQNGLSNLALSTANQFEYEIYDLLSKAINATIVADSPTDFEINSFAKFSANIATDGITGSYTLNSWNVATAAEISSLLSKTSAAATVIVDANYMSSTQLISISSNISKVDSITNLQLNVSDFTDQQTADLLNVATNVEIIGTASADTIDGGTGADTITGGAGNDSMTGGDGSDVFVFAAGVTGTPSSTNFEVISDWNKSYATDKIDFDSTSLTFVIFSTTAATGTASIASGIATFAAADDTVTERIVAAEAGLALGGTATAGQTVLFRQGSDSYVFISDGTDGVGENDVLIKLANRSVSSGTISNGDLEIDTAFVYTAAEFNANIANINATDTVYVMDTLANVNSDKTNLNTNIAKLDRIILTDTSVAAAALNEIDTTLSIVIDVSAATAVIGTASDIATTYATVSTAIYGLGDEVVTLSNTSITAADLIAIEASTTGMITASSVMALTGTSADITTAILSQNITKATSLAITASDTMTVTQANTIDATTTGVITATISSDTAANLATLSGTGNAYTVTISDTTVTAHDLILIDAATTVAVNATAATTITGTVADILALLNSSLAGTISLSGNESITVIDTSANIQTSLANLVTNAIKIDSIDSIDNAEITLTAAQAVALTNKLSANDTIIVTDSLTNIQTNLSTLLADTKIDNIEVNPPISPPTFSSATVNGSSLVMTYTSDLSLSATTAVTSAFSVMVDGVTDTVTGVSVDTTAKTVVLTLASPVTHLQSVTVAYTDPTVGDDVYAIQNAIGSDAASFAAQPVTNNTEGSGKVTTDFSNSSERGRSVAIQSDGKIIIAGSDEANNTFAILRYNPNGSLDMSFGTNGKITTTIASAAYAKAVDLQNDGKILVGGWGVDGSNVGFTLARYNNDGSLDTSFDNDGKVITVNGAYGYAMAQSNGKILVAGGYSDFILVSYNTDGSLNTSFGSGGVVTTDFGTSDDRAISITVQSDNKILATGTKWDGTNHYVIVARYNADGTLDSNFGSGGKVSTYLGASYAFASSITTQTDGKILVAGGVQNASYNFALIRYNDNGSLDTNFGTGGIVITDISSVYNDSAQSVAVQTDGKILVGGTSGIDFAVARYNIDGSLDSNFGISGKVTTDFGGSDEGYSLSLQGDGKIILTGSSVISGSSDFATARYNTDGSLDTTFGM